MTESEDVWRCHPDLETEWSDFASECHQSVKSDLYSDLWMNFWKQSIPSKNEGNDVVNVVPSDEDVKLSADEKPEETVSSEQRLMESQGMVQYASLDGSQLKQINSLVLELLDVVEMAGEEPSEDLREEIRSLSHAEVSVLLRELQIQISDQGASNMCILLCDVDPWISVALIFKELLLPKTCGPSKPAGGGIGAGIIRLAEQFPSDCTCHLLKPLIVKGVSSPSQLEILSRLVPLLPENDFTALLRHIVHQCDSPLEEWQILALNTTLSNARVGIVESAAVSPLQDLLPVLSASARTHSASESFASLLLKVIPILKSNISVSKRNELIAIVQQNSSFNKQAIMNAIMN